MDENEKRYIEQFLKNRGIDDVYHLLTNFENMEKTLKLFKAEIEKNEID